MAFYFLAVAPALARLRPGLYAAGIWADGAYAPYDEIARWAFSESPEIRLLIVLRGRGKTLHLSVPPGEYGAVQKALSRQVRSQVLHPDPDILNLSKAD
jgi:hypothetical protein